MHLSFAQAGGLQVRLGRFGRLFHEAVQWTANKARQLVCLAGMLGDMKIKDVLRLLEGDGWYLVNTRGSHRQFKHPYKAGRVTVAGKPSDDLAPGTLNSILKQAGLKR